MKSIFFCIGYIIASTVCAFSQLPKTDILITNVILSAGKMTITKPASICGKSSYNDEPVFSPDGKSILYISHSDSLGHTEIYKYSTKTKTSAMFTSSADVKHTPAIMPDGKNVSFLAAEPPAHQRLWKMPLAGGAPELIFKDKDSIGNYCWMSSDSIALQVLKTPTSLQAVSISTGAAKMIAQNVSSCIKRMPSQLPIPGKWENCWIFIERTKDNKRTMESFVYGKKSKLVVMEVCPECSMLEGSENFCMAKAGIFSASGSKVYLFDSESQTNWTEVADLSKYGIKNIKSITFSPDEKKLLIVNTK